jgi:hypothetical protein
MSSDEFRLRDEHGVEMWVYRQGSGMVFDISKHLPGPAPNSSARFWLADAEVHRLLNWLVQLFDLQPRVRAMSTAKGEAMHETFAVTSADRRIIQLACAVDGAAKSYAQMSGLSPFEVCIALANALGHALAESGVGASRADALARIETLREIIQGAYDLHDVWGEG